MPITVVIWKLIPVIGFVVLLILLYQTTKGEGETG